MAPCMSLTVRAYRSDDEFGIMAGFNASFGLVRDERYWCWKYLHDGKAMAWLAVDDQQRVLTHLAAHPITWSSPHGDWQVAHAGDAFALRLPEVAHGRAMLKTIAAFHRAQREHNELKLLFGFPSATLSGLHQTLTPLHGKQRPIQLWQHLPCDYPPNSLVHSGLPERKALDALWLRCAERYTLSCRRDSEWVSWRFLQRPDVQDYIYLHVIDSAGELACWAVLRKKEGVLWICDVLWDGISTTSIENLLQQTRFIAMQGNCTSISMWMEGDAALVEILTQLSWENISHSHCVQLLMHAYDTSLDYEWIRNSLYITKADSDLI